MDKLVIQTRDTYNPDPPDRAEHTYPAVNIHGPFSSEEMALSYIEDLHLARQAGDGTWEFIIDAQFVATDVNAKIEPD
jgi:hypothetical protein